MENWDETTLNQELDALLDEVLEPVDIERKIEEAIQRKIKRVVVKTVTILGAGIIVLVLLINPFLNAVFLNPHKLNKTPYEKETSKSTQEHQDGTSEGDAELSLFLGVLRNYWETMQPFTEVIEVDVEKKGFARYELNMLVSNRRGMLNMGIHNVWCDVEYGKYKNIVDPELRFVHRYTYNYKAYQKEDYIEKMKKLPDSAMIYLTIGEINPREYEKLKTDLEKRQICLDWIQVYQPEVDFQGGLSINLQAAWKETDMRYKMTSDQLKQVYLSNLNSLIDHIEIWKQLGLHSNNTTYYMEEQRLKETYEDARTMENLMCKNYSIYGEKEDILSYFENTQLEFFDIYGVDFTSWGN